MITKPSSPAELPERVARLESANRRLFGIVVLLVIAAFVQTFWHFLPTPGVLNVSRVALKPPGQPARAEMQLWADGTPAFRLNNDRGEARALFALRRDGNLSLRMTDSTFQNRLELVVGPDGTPHVVVAGKDGRPRAHLWVDPANQPHLDYPGR